MGIGSIAYEVINVSAVGSVCSNSSAIFPPLIVLVAFMTAILMVCSWFVSSLLEGASRLFVKWLPLVLLWVPVPVAPGVIFPSGIALIFFIGDQKGGTRILVAECIGILCFYIACVLWHRGQRNHSS